MKKIILILSGLIFAVWMLLVHEPSDLVSDELMGTVTEVQHVEDGLVTLQVELEDGRTVEVDKPPRMPEQVGSGVRMEAYQSRWFGNDSYQVRNWRLN